MYRKDFNDKERAIKKLLNVIWNLNLQLVNYICITTLYTSDDGFKHRNTRVEVYLIMYLVNILFFLLPFN